MRNILVFLFLTTLSVYGQASFLGGKPEVTTLDQFTNYFITVLGSGTNAPIRTINSSNAIEYYKTLPGFSPILTNSQIKVFYVRTNGNDSTGTNRFDRAFATPFAAVAAARNAGVGSSVIVEGGSYNNGVTNLGFNGTLIFDGPKFTYVGNVLDHGCGILDDRFSGAITQSVIGGIEFNYCPGTNVHWDSICNPTGNTNALAAIVITNVKSLINWNVATKGTAWGAAPIPQVLYVKNCHSNTIFKTFTIFNGSPGQTNSYTLTNCPADPGTEIIISAEGIPLYWELGTFHFEFDRIDNIGSLFLGAYGVDTTDRADLYIKGQQLNGKAYVVGRSINWKVWLDVQEWKYSGPNNVNTFNAYNTGSHYIHAQKMSGFSPSAASGYVILLENPQTSDTNLTVWVDIDKLSHSNGAVRVTHGQLRGRIGHIEQNGPNNGTPTISITNISALISLSGENIYGANTILEHGGGITELRGYNIISTNRDPILVTGSGLTLSTGIQLTGPTNGITAKSAQTVNGSYYGSLPHQNITLNKVNYGNYTKPLMIATNFGTIFDDGWFEMVIEEWVAQPTSIVGNIGIHHWNNIATGTLPSLSAPIIESNAWSYVSIVTTQSSSGRLLQTPNSAGAGVGIVLTNADYLFEARIRMNSTNLSGDVATTRVGLTDLPLGTGEAGNGVYIMNNTNVNTNIFVLVTALSGTRTFTYTPGVAANTYDNQTWASVMIYVPSPGNTAYGFVGPDRFRMTSFATNTANLPGTTAQLGAVFQADRIASTSGTNFRTNYCDRVRVWVRPYL